MESIYFEGIQALALVLSLIFVAYEIRQNTKSNKLKNWEGSVDRFNTLFKRTDNIEISNIIIKGRKDYSSCSDSEKEIFNNYYFELILCYEGMLIQAENQPHGEQLLEIPFKHLSYHFSHKGVNEWWDNFNKNIGTSPLMFEFVESVIKKTATL